jgi:hypothetical protein
LEEIEAYSYVPLLFQSFNGGTNLINSEDNNNVCISPPIQPRIIEVTLFDINHNNNILAGMHIVVCPRSAVIDRTFRVYKNFDQNDASLNIAMFYDNIDGCIKMPVLNESQQNGMVKGSASLVNNDISFNEIVPSNSAKLHVFICYCYYLLIFLVYSFEFKL